MKKLVFAALAFTAIIWGTAGGTSRPSRQEHLTMQEVPAAWSLTETAAAPDPSINVW
jgi:hypothetical protein